MKESKLEFGIASDLYTAGYHEDGVPFVAQQYYILATDETGRRWRHATLFNGCTVSRDDEGFSHFTDIRTTAMVSAERLLTRIEAANGVINFDCWSETFPEYGSHAYVMDPVDLDDAEYY